ncbi:MAG: hypothetical protein WBW36_20415, partial [Candidatus Sulfotelmatobacter sp.]
MAGVPSEYFLAHDGGSSLVGKAAEKRDAVASRNTFVQLFFFSSSGLIGGQETVGLANVPSARGFSPVSQEADSISKRRTTMTTKGKVLVLVSSGRGLPLKDGKVY